MSEHADIVSLIKTRGIISGAVATLFLLSSAAVATKTGPACVQPGPGGLTAAQWADARDAVTTKGHLVACHIGKAAEKSGEAKHAIQRPIGGTGTNVVGSGYNAASGAFTIKDNQKFVLLFAKDTSKGWYVLTGYPK